MNITTTGLKAGSLFKFLWLGNTFGWLPLFIISGVQVGVSAMLGQGTLTIFNQPVRGPLALVVVLVAHPILWPLATTALSCFQWLVFVPGFWLYSKWGRLSLSFKDASAR